MRSVYRLALLSSIVLIVVIALWFRSEHLQKMAYPDQESYESQMAFSEQLAEDFVMTIELFMEQVKHDLRDWDTSLSKEENDLQKLKEELVNHDHIDGFAAYEMPSKNMIFEKGSMPEDALDKLQKNTLKETDSWQYSEPYTSHGSKKMLIGLVNSDNVFLSEVDLSFIENYMKELAAISDNNGNFFIGDSDMDVAFSEEEASIDDQTVTKQVQELDWSIYVSSEPEMKEREETKKGEVIVVLEEGINAKKWAKKHGVFVIDETEQTVVVRDLTRDVDEMIVEWEGDPAIKYMEPNFTFKKQTTTRKKEKFSSQANLPNDEFYDLYQWNLKQLHLEEAWDQTRGKQKVPVAIIDSGVDPEHRDLKDRIMKGYNAFEDNEAYYDDNGHGTHVAGIFGAVTNNESGIAGVTWDNPILAVKVLDDEAMGDSFSIAKGIRWATDNGAKVINLSLGDEHNSEVMHEAVKYAYNRDVVLIAATGNDNVDTPMYPAGYKEVLAVGSNNENQERSFYSNYGAHTDVTAPGEHIPSTFLGDEYVMMSGTSMSSPHVAGIASLIRSEDPQLSNEDVYEIIRLTAEDLGPKGYDIYYGFGMANAKKALGEN
ncbi:S8 family peptidase [Salipaludibacillus daqingensis]|uniref:S8 family peptidase n=1 Tax=Salipaludibacillus daqingensis TaxID=3041001 RepID=UPI002473FA0D|nr:S8 family peptidase [Salipaludibacillus daqingensis]